MPFIAADAEEDVGATSRIDIAAGGVVTGGVGTDSASALTRRMRPVLVVMIFVGAAFEPLVCCVVICSPSCACGAWRLRRRRQTQ